LAFFCFFPFDICTPPVGTTTGLFPKPISNEVWDGLRFFGNYASYSFKSLDRPAWLEVSLERKQDVKGDGGGKEGKVKTVEIGVHLCLLGT
jgi:hypothetical protein